MKKLLCLFIGFFVLNMPLFAQYWGPNRTLTELGQRTEAAVKARQLIPWMQAVRQAEKQANSLRGSKEGNDPSFRHDCYIPCSDLPQGKDTGCWTRYQRLYRAMDTNPLVAGYSIRYGSADDIFLLEEDDIAYIRAFFSQPTTQGSFDPAYAPVSVETLPNQQVLLTVGRHHHTRFHFLFHTRNRTVFFYYNDL